MTLSDILAKKKPGKTGGIKITAESEKAQIAKTIKATLDATAPKIHPPTPQPRELGEMDPGETIPMDHPADPNNEADHAWFMALHSFASALCVVIEPAPSSHAWLAVNNPQQPRPILLHRLPLHNRPSNANPF